MLKIYSMFKSLLWGIVKLCSKVIKWFQDKNSFQIFDKHTYLPIYLCWHVKSWEENVSFCQISRVLTKLIKSLVFYISAWRDRSTRFGRICSSSVTPCSPKYYNPCFETWRNICGKNISWERCHFAFCTTSTLFRKCHSCQTEKFKKFQHWSICSLPKLSTARR